MTKRAPNERRVGGLEPVGRVMQRVLDLLAEQRRRRACATAMIWMASGRTRKTMEYGNLWSRYRCAPSSYVGHVLGLVAIAPTAASSSVMNVRPSSASRSEYHFRAARASSRAAG